MRNLNKKKRGFGIKKSVKSKKKNYVLKNKK